MLSGEWFGTVPGQVDAFAADLEGAAVRNVSSFGGLAGSSSRSSSLPGLFVPDPGDVPVEQRGGADVVGVVVGVDEVLDLVADAVGGGDLVDRALDVVADRGWRVEQDDAVGGGEERALVGAVGDPVEVLLDAADVVALLVQGGAEGRARDRRIVRQGGGVRCAHVLTPSVATVASAWSRSRIRPWRSPSGPSIRPASVTPPTFTGSNPAALMRRRAMASAASSSVA